ncbi:hypothetical protein HBE96_25490 [Clostridium sp. P21]|uniref:Uncharacterized protein n=2 Tax=Clostridium TaxID=1485 RepID=C6PPP0_9CLOT|nr:MULTISPECIES: hypothetical protein [Clostridium]AKN30348.1 hypothetical protein Ccar_05730 [Clostridium carboxidivorans P7]EET88770.1 hypothetical protein CcarbDRAFT_0757 [Clostridium carboxidivorans P7]NMM65935.1 hypothetical protein [Clostridium muellerianum]
MNISSNYYNYSYYNQAYQINALSNPQLYITSTRTSSSPNSDSSEDKVQKVSSKSSMHTEYDSNPSFSNLYYTANSLINLLKLKGINFSKNP